MKKSNILLCLSGAVLVSFSPILSAEEHLETIQVVSDRVFASGERFIGGSKVILSRDSESVIRNIKTQQATSLGQTVEKVSGVQNNSFGPSNGIPQIRSLLGSRVSVNENGLAMTGVSALSGNMPTAINPAMADSITVYKSSASVLYGGHAIGGAVNVSNGQIPHKLPEELITGRLELSGGFNSTWDQAIALNGKFGKKSRWAWHLDAMNSYTSGYKIRTGASPKADVCYNKDVMFRPTVSQTGKKIGMGINSELARACQMWVEADVDFNPAAYPLLDKNYADALAKGEEGVKEYKEKWGLDDLKKQHISMEYMKNLKWWHYLLLYKNKHQFAQLPPEQQVILAEKWGGYIVPNFSKLAPNPDYDPEAKPETARKLTRFQDMVPIEKGKITNSHMRNSSFNGGVSYVGDKGYAGMSLGFYDTKYGVPGFASLQSATDVGSTVVNRDPVNIHGRQIKLSLEGSYDLPTAYLGHVKAKLNYLNALNEEYLADTFASSMNAQQVQGRVEMTHQYKKWTSGVVGLDFSYRDIAGKGANRFLPHTKSGQVGLFAMQNFTWKYVDVKLGGRYEYVGHRMIVDDDYRPSQHMENDDTGEVISPLEKKWKPEKRFQQFNLYDVFVDLKVKPTQWLALNARYSRSDRAPDVNELFAGNFHYAVLTDEQGSPDLTKETARTIELGADIQYKDTSLSATYYHTRYDGYMYLANTGMSRFDLEVKEHHQSSTRIDGFEFEFNQYVDIGDDHGLDIRLFADLVKNKPVNAYTFRGRHDGKYMPNLPTSRLGAGLSWNKGGFKLGATWTYYMVQKYATETNMESHKTQDGSRINIDLPSYHVVDAYMSYDLMVKQRHAFEFFMDIRNLFNVKANPNNSTLKYITPLPGRSVRFGVRYSF
ncbi:MAG: TonB-dependent receptor [Alcaligenaceae bacterium]|nr:TonB-dependent receptor [Alcaligenaceae bacterium]